jgi:hypothetical protein
MGCRKEPLTRDKPDKNEPYIETVWTASSTSQHSFAAGGSNHYWMDPSAHPNVLYVHRPGAEPTRLWAVDSPSGNYRRFAANDHGAFVTMAVPVDGGVATQIKFVPEAGAPPFLFAQTWNDVPVAVWSDQVAFADFDRVLVAKVNEPAVLVARTETPALALAMRGTRVAWLERKKGAAEADLKSTSAPGGPVTTLATSIPITRRVPPMLAFDDANLYVLEGSSMSRAAQPDAALDDGMTGYRQVTSIALTDGHAQPALRSDWPIVWFAAYGDRIYAWELDPKNEVEGRLKSKPLHGTEEPRIEVTSLAPRTAARPPFAIDEQWISWTNLSGFHRLARSR